MSYTKRQFISLAFEELGMASYVYDLEPEQMQGALRKLDAMLSTWNGAGIKLGYPLPSSPENSNLDEESNVPDIANEAIAQNLAIRIAPSFGKTVSPDTKMFAKQAYRTMLNSITSPNPMALPHHMPNGSGNKSNRHNNFIKPSHDTVTTDGNDSLEFN